MSKLADAIRRSQRIEASPMGFGTARPTAKPSMLVGFLCADTAIEAARDAGADLILVDARDRQIDGSEASRLRSGAGDVALGVWSPVTNGDTAKQLHEGGVDFLVLDPESTPAAALLDDDLGYVLELGAVPEELFLRSLEPLSFEALYMGDISTPLTVARQIELSRIRMLAGKPLLCNTAPDLSKEDLQCLRAAGVLVLLTDSLEGLAYLKETVASLPQRKQRRDDRPVVSLPRGAAPTESDDDEDE